ncbi:hypothetical protein BH11VER1_BH11VER1_19880 [soil metagenome]
MSELIQQRNPVSNALAPAIDVEHQSPAASKAKSFTLPFDPLRLIDAIYAKRWLVLIAGIATATGLGAFCWKKFETHHTAVAQLIKQGPTASLRQSEGGDPYTPHDMAIPTFMALMRSGTVMEKATARLNGKISESLLRSGLVITPERNTDIVRVSINSDKDSETALAGLESFVAEVLFLTRDIQQRDAAEMRRFIVNQVAQTENDLIKVNEELLAYSKREQLIDPDKQIDAWLGELGNYTLKYESTRLDFETLDLKIGGIQKELAKVSPAAAKLQNAREDLAQLKLRYTDEHPTVLESAERVKALEATMQDETPRLDSPPKPGESTVAESLYLDLVKLRGEKEVLGEQVNKLAIVRSNLNDKLAQLPRKALELARIKSRKVALEMSRNLLAAREREAAFSEENAQGSFRLLSMSRLQDVIVERPEKKIAAVTAGGFVGAAGLVALIFAAFAAMDRRLVTAHDLKRATKLPVLGSLWDKSSESSSDWAFRTWTSTHPSLLAQVPGGTLVCGLLSDESSQLPVLLGRAAAQRGSSVIVVSHSNDELTSGSLASVVARPDTALRQLRREPEQIVHLSLTDEWQWSALQRKQWADALAHWSKEPNIVVLVELTAPKKPEILLVAERMPNLLWIGAGGESQVSTIQAQIEIYRSAGCRMVGALLHKAESFRLPLLNRLALAACVLFSAAQLDASEAVKLGPGDIVNITVAGQPELERKGITVSPDGSVTYLQAQAIPAAGLTIDEVRASLNKELRRYYKNAIVTVTPNLFQSRKVYVLGKVVKKGAINLDRPMTLLEIVAEAGGLETGLFQQNTVELADLGRSFLSRGNERVKVDMESLFLHGDMAQNVVVQPGDYLYFPSANSNEIYVLGDVKMQGAQGLLAHTSVHSAIAQAGGFTPKAYTKRVLVVRGSFDKPQTFVVNMDDIMHAKTKGFRLEPKDIVYIADSPWARAEELVSFAVNAFLQGAVSSWTGANIGPMIKQAILPSL